MIKKKKKKMFYRELHLDSGGDGRTSGTSSVPFWQFVDTVWIKKFIVKRTSIPITFDNVFVDCTITILCSYPHPNPGEDDDPDIYFELNVSIPKGYYDGKSFAELLTTDFNIVKNNSAYVVLYPDIALYVQDDSKLYISQLNTTNPMEGKFGFGFSFPDGSPSNCRLIQKLLGYGTEPTTLPVPPAMNLRVEVSNSLGEPFVAVSNGIKFSSPNYLMIRSSMGTGSRFTSSIRGRAIGENRPTQGAFNSSNIIGKIDLNPGTTARNTEYTFVNPALDPGFMFDYDGEYIDNMSVFFTYPNTDIPVDFGVYNFSLTIGIMTDRA